MYSEDHKQLANDRQTWPEFETLARKLQEDAEKVISEDDVPWPPSDVIGVFASNISKERKEASTVWIESVDVAAAEVDSLSAADANRVYARASAPPAVLTQAHAERLEKLLRKIEARLDDLKIDWLVEKFRELSPALREKFLETVVESKGLRGDLQV
jgi:hypothetical protein